MIAFYLILACLAVIVYLLNELDDRNHS